MSALVRSKHFNKKVNTLREMGALDRPLKGTKWDNCTYNSTP